MIRRKLVSTLLIISLTVAGLAVSQIDVMAAGSAWYVDDAGSDTTGDGSMVNPWATIQYAVDQATDGDAIYVASGSYNGNIIVDKSLTIESRNGCNQTTVTAADADDSVFTVTADNVTIKGFTITGATDNSGIFIDYADYNTISGNICSNNDDGIYILYSYNNTISGNKINYNGDDGIEVSFSSGNYIASNECTDNYYGINLYRSGGNLVSGNDCRDNVNNGISVSFCSNEEITGNNCSDVTSYGIFLKNSSGTAISGNICSGNYGYGIYLMVSDNNSIFENVCTDNDHCGIEIYDSADNEITSNDCSDNAGNGIAIISSSGDSVSGNLCTDCLTGIYVEDSSDITISDNECDHNAGYGINIYGFSGSITLNSCCYNGYGIGLGGLSNTDILYNSFCDNAEDGVYYSGEPGINSVHINNNNVTGNTGYGVYNQEDATLDAENNWWGSSSGPAYSGNPGGSGDEVNDNVDYDPWLGEGFFQGTLTGAINGRYAISHYGRLMEDVEKVSDNGRLTFIIPEGTYVLDASGEPVYEIGISLSSDEAFYGDSVISLEFTPGGTNFSAPVTFIYYYGDTGLTDEQAEKLVFVYYDGSDWRTLTTLVNTSDDTITAYITHFTGIALVKTDDITGIIYRTIIRGVTVTSTIAEGTVTSLSVIKTIVTETLTTTESSSTTIVSTQVLPPVTYTEAGLNVTVTEKTTSVTTQVRNVDVTDWTLTVIIGIGALLLGVLITIILSRK